MSRIDGELMDAVEGLRLIHQWGAGLDGVDLASYGGIAERVADNVRRLEQARPLRDRVNGGPVAAQASRES